MFIDKPYLYGQMVRFAHSSTSDTDLANQIRKCDPLFSRIPGFVPIMVKVFKFVIPKGRGEEWPEEFPDEMDQLEAMGFLNKDANRAALEATKGDIEAAINRLTYE